MIANHFDDDPKPRSPSLKTPSHYQQAIFDWVRNGEGNAVVSAYAGSGKTTTLVEAARFIPPEDLLFLAFNRSIVDELKRRLPHGSRVYTLNGLGHRSIMQYLNRPITLDANKYDQIIHDLLMGAELGRLYPIPRAAVRKATKALVSFAQATLCDLKDEALEEMALHFGIDLDVPKQNEDDEDEERITPAVLYAFTRTVLKVGEKQVEEGILSYDDQIWIPVKWGLRPPKARFVFIDECQDLSKAKLELALSACAKGGRILAVGDRRQAINGFSGADANAFDSIIERTNATVLPLSVSYRCPINVVLEAQEIVPDIEYADHASPGWVKEIDERDMLEDLRGGDLILCRLTAPLVSLCIDLIRRRIPARVKGRDIGKSLIAVAAEALGDDEWKRFGDCLSEWYDWKRNKIKQRKNPESQLQSLADKVEGVRVCYESFRAQTFAQFEAEISSLFSDKKEFIELSTVHRAKGLEARSVFIIRPDTLPLKWKGQLDWQFTQEENLRYVAITRAMHELYYVQEPEEKKKARMERMKERAS